MLSNSILKRMSAMYVFVGSSRLWIGIFIALFLFSCSYSPKEKPLANFQHNNDAIILSSSYKMSKDTIEFRRILKDGLKILVQHGQLFTGQYALGYQRLSILTELGYEKKILDSLSDAYQSQGFVPRIANTPVILFVQVAPDSAMSKLQYLGFLNLRQRMEDKIDASLQAENLGEWIAGDMGAGANMLFSVNDWDAAQTTVLAILTKEQLQDHVLIAKRIMISEDDWLYEVTHPVAYQGVFNSM